VASLLTVKAVASMIRTTHHALKIDFAIETPRIAVAGLNPHGGENKLFGDEEEQVIGPAVKQMQAENMNVSGPYPPDTVFFKAASGAFDAVVCMYHDQGLIPFKLLHFADGVNITLGLPLVRTSVDHGTAYDIAGKGLADYRSLDEAVRLAAVISRNRSIHHGQEIRI
jgi:4-hydroxythreonine-4-phosphate dehydrogenase